MMQSRDDEEAETAVKDAILALPGSETIDRIAVFPTEDDYGEPGFSVAVYLKDSQERASGARLLDAITAAADALRERKDYRFPYVTFLTTEDDGADDTRPAA